MYYRGYGFARPRCLLAIVAACVTMLPTLSGIDVNFTMFDCQLCSGSIYCASHFQVSDVAATRCEQLGMTLADEVRLDKKHISTVLEKCAFPLPGIGGTINYWINGSSDSHGPTVPSSMCTSTLIQSLARRYLTSMAFCFGGNYPYICEEIVDSGWKEMGGILYGLTSLKHNLCFAEAACERLGGQLGRDAGINMTSLAFELQLQALMPLNLWVNITGKFVVRLYMTSIAFELQLQALMPLNLWVNNAGKNCMHPMSESLHFKADGNVVTEIRRTTVHFHGLCEKRPAVSTVPVTMTQTATQVITSTAPANNGVSVEKSTTLIPLTSPVPATLETTQIVHSSTDSTVYLPGISATQMPHSSTDSTVYLPGISATQMPHSSTDSTVYLPGISATQMLHASTDSTIYSSGISATQMLHASSDSTIYSSGISSTQMLHASTDSTINLSGISATQMLHASTVSTIYASGISATQMLHASTVSTIYASGIPATQILHASTDSTIYSSGISATQMMNASTDSTIYSSGISATQMMHASTDSTIYSSGISATQMMHASTDSTVYSSGISATQMMHASTDSTVYSSGITATQMLHASTDSTINLSGVLSTATIQQQTLTWTTTNQQQVSTLSMTNPSYVGLMSTTNPPTNGPQTSLVSTPTNSPASGWIKDNQREFYVNRNETNFTEATDACKNTMNASMLFFTNALQYLDISRTLQLPPGNFWVGVVVNGSHHQCLQLRVKQNHKAILSKADCRQMTASICSRASNVSDVLDNPSFVRLIADMTVDSSKTQRAKRKLVSVYEERKSATAVGSIGVIVVVSVLTLVALLDLSRLKCRCRYGDKKMEKVKVIHERKPPKRGYSVSDSTC